MCDGGSARGYTSVRAARAYRATDRRFCSARLARIFARGQTAAMAGSVADAGSPPATRAAAKSAKAKSRRRGFCCSSSATRTRSEAGDAFPLDPDAPVETEDAPAETASGSSPDARVDADASHPDVDDGETTAKDGSAKDGSASADGPDEVHIDLESAAEDAPGDERSRQSAGDARREPLVDVPRTPTTPPRDADPDETTRLLSAAEDGDDVEANRNRDDRENASASASPSAPDSPTASGKRRREERRPVPFYRKPFASCKALIITWTTLATVATLGLCGVMFQYATPFPVVVVGPDGRALARADGGKHTHDRGGGGDDGFEANFGVVDGGDANDPDDETKTTSSRKTSKKSSKKSSKTSSSKKSSSKKSSSKKSSSKKTRHRTSSSARLGLDAVELENEGKCVPKHFDAIHGIYRQYHAECVSAASAPARAAELGCVEGTPCQLCYMAGTPAETQKESTARCRAAVCERHGAKGCEGEASTRKASAAAEATLGAARDEYEDARDEYEDGYSFVGDEDGVRTGARTRSNVFGDADGDVVFGDVDGDRFGDRFGDVGDGYHVARRGRGGARSDLEGYASGVAASGADDGVDALVASVTGGGGGFGGRGEAARGAFGRGEAARGAFGRGEAVRGAFGRDVGVDGAARGAFGSRRGGSVRRAGPTPRHRVGECSTDPRDRRLGRFLFEDRSCATGSGDQVGCAPRSACGFCNTHGRSDLDEGEEEDSLESGAFWTCPRDVCEVHNLRVTLCDPA